MKLKLEINTKFVPSNDTFRAGNHIIMITPAIGEDYWILRVKVGRKQAIVAFPKFNQIGIGFQYEKNWNTNLPSRMRAEHIYAHIKRNKGSKSIPDERCIEAIQLIQKHVSKLDT